MLYRRPKAFFVIRTQKFTASGTYTPHAKMVYCEIECIGAGASGGGAAATTAGTMNGAGGGGAGGLSRKIASRADIGASQVVTIGAAGPAPAAGNNPGNAGGDTSVGALCIAKGGSPGGGAAAAAAAAGGNGGVPGTGDETFVGGHGDSGISASITTILMPTSGRGGNSAGGFGGRPKLNAGGDAGTGFGGGGSGGADYNNTGAQAGGQGTPGYVLVTEYCSA